MSAALWRLRAHGWRRTVGIVALVAAAMLLVYASAAFAEYRGSDLFDNIGPGASPAGNTLLDKWPASAFGLDWHVDAGITNIGSSVAATLTEWLSSALWFAASTISRLTIMVFTWAFSLDLLNGPGGGTLPIVGTAISNLYTTTFGSTWLVAAFVVAGIWAIWHGFFRRRFIDTFVGLAMSVVFVCAALFFVLRPVTTIGTASSWSNDISTAVLSGINGKGVDTNNSTRVNIANQMFTQQIYQPWVVLEFNGLRHCVDEGQQDADGFPAAVKPGSPNATTCRDHIKQDSAGYGGYADHYLAYAPGSPERDAFYESMKDGKKEPVISVLNLCDTKDPTCKHPDPFGDWKIDKADAAAVDIQQAGGGLPFERLAIAALALVGSVGFALLVGSLSLLVVLSQVLVLIFLGFSVIALLAAAIPGRGHALFTWWATQLGTAIFLKAVYSVTLAIIIVVTGAVSDFVDALGWLASYGIVASIYLLLFWKRRSIVDRLLNMITGAGGGEHETAARRSWRHGRHAMEHPMDWAMGVRDGFAAHVGRQQSATSGEADEGKQTTKAEVAATHQDDEEGGGSDAAGIVDALPEAGHTEGVGGTPDDTWGDGAPANGNDNGNGAVPDDASWAPEPEDGAPAAVVEPPQEPTPEPGRRRWLTPDEGAGPGGLGDWQPSEGRFPGGAVPANGDGNGVPEVDMPPDDALSRARAERERQRREQEGENGVV